MTLAKVATMNDQISNDRDHSCLDNSETDHSKSEPFEKRTLKTFGFGMMFGIPSLDFEPPL